MVVIQSPQPEPYQVVSLHPARQYSDCWLLFELCHRRSLEQGWLLQDWKSWLDVLDRPRASCAENAKGSPLYTGLLGMRVCHGSRSACATEMETEMEMVVIIGSRVQIVRYKLLVINRGACAQTYGVF